MARLLAPADPPEGCLSDAARDPATLPLPAPQNIRLRAPVFWARHLRNDLEHLGRSRIAD